MVVLHFSKHQNYPESWIKHRLLGLPPELRTGKFGGGADDLFAFSTSPRGDAAAAGLASHFENHFVLDQDKDSLRTGKSK